MDSGIKRQTKTSTEVKRRYNDKTYTRLYVSVRKDKAEEFKASCEARRIPYSDPLHAAVETMIDGQRVVLPYGLRIGAKLYSVVYYGRNRQPCYEIEESVLSTAKINETTGLSLFHRRNDGYCYMLDIEQLGKTIFTSKEAAEEKGEELYGEKKD